uniref:Neuritin 1-like b n=1 Tax=Scophthalmus maximus TaxID=52904 RepID=A0A8D3E3X2_SCOMX
SSNFIFFEFSASRSFTSEPLVQRWDSTPSDSAEPNHDVPSRHRDCAAAHRSLPRSWNAFHVCANSALAGCPGEAAAVWESLRQESRKTQFSGNLYDMCASRTTLPPSTVPAPQSPPTSDQTNQETLKGRTYKHSPTLSTLLFPAFSTLLVLLRS